MAPSLHEIRLALGRTIEQNVEATVYTYGIEAIGALPAIIVYPEQSDFDGAFMQGWDTWDFSLVIFVSSQDLVSAQETLDELVTGTGESSIREVIDNNENLGFPEDTDVQAQVLGLLNYGGTFSWYGTKHLGAVLQVRVHVNNARG